METNVSIIVADKHEKYLLDYEERK